MKQIISLLACFAVCVVLLLHRISYSDANNKPLHLTGWDAFGYYMYLPGMFIYKDVTQLKWVPAIDSQYAVTGGKLYQANKVANGNYVFKYLGGVALMQMPLFFIGHEIAKHTTYPADGFSPPYQYALGLGILLYCMLAILLLRKILLKYFSDVTTAITITLVCLSTNFVQYVAIDSAQSHSYIFPLYVLILYATIAWHKQPKVLWALSIGYIIGLATIGRPTEAVMLFIPLFWNTASKETAKAKWLQVKQYRSHVAIAALGCLLGILPQLLYWKYTSGSFIYDVGSSWRFLTPYFRVLFGWEKGWFIYTPVTVFFIIGMFFMNWYPFKRSVLWFCLLNIWIVIAWADWRYGGSYAARALMQSYPVFALPFAAFIERINTNKWKWLFYIIGMYLLLVNLFQIWQYNKTILHYNDMNRQYYGSIYLNAHPTPLDMSLLDTHEILHSEDGYTASIITDTSLPYHITHDNNTTLFEKDMTGTKTYWLKLESRLTATGIWESRLNAEIKIKDSVKTTSIRLYNALNKDGVAGNYAFYMYVPQYFANGHLKVYINPYWSFEGNVTQLKISQLVK